MPRAFDEGADFRSSAATAAVTLRDVALVILVSLVFISISGLQTKAGMRRCFCPPGIASRTDVPRKRDVSFSGWVDLRRGLGFLAPTAANRPLGVFFCFVRRFTVTDHARCSIQFADIKCRSRLRRAGLASCRRDAQEGCAKSKTLHRPVRQHFIASGYRVHSCDLWAVQSASASLMMSPMFRVKLWRVLKARRTGSWTRNNRGSVAQSVTT